MKRRFALSIVALLIGGCLLAGCSTTRWKAEDGTTKVRHGLVIRSGWELYIGDDGHGETTAKWGAEGGSDVAEEPQSE